jgi:hypothetical protein
VRELRHDAEDGVRIGAPGDDDSLDLLMLAHRITRVSLARRAVESCPATQPKRPQPTRHRICL